MRLIHAFALQIDCVGHLQSWTRNSSKERSIYLLQDFLHHTFHHIENGARRDYLQWSLPCPRGKTSLQSRWTLNSFTIEFAQNSCLGSSTLAAIGLSLGFAERILTRDFLIAIDTWYRSAPDYGDRPLGAIPVAFPPQKSLPMFYCLNLIEPLQRECSYLLWPLRGCGC